jgi:hypothetical protein
MSKPIMNKAAVAAVNETYPLASHVTRQTWRHVA